MTDRKGETLKVEGKQNSLFPIGAAIKCFVIPPNLKKIKQTTKNTICLMPAHSQICVSFKVHDLITCEWNVQVVVFLGS